MVDQGYAYVNQGTTWQGIYDTLKHIGHKTVVWIGRNDPMTDAWKELNKGNRIGVLLVDNSYTPDGTYWTSSGHYVAFTDYKVKGGQHWFYIKDSGGRNHDGWFCYEKSIKGALPQLWIVEKLGSKPSPTPTPTKKTKVIDVSAFQSSINWAKVKAAGIDGAMIRCGYRGYESAKLNEDGMFLDHIKGASKAGLKVGVYFFTEAINAKEGKEEAEYTLKLIEKAGVKLYYPIAVDTEAQSAPTERAKNLTKAQRTAAIKGFCEGIKAHGGDPMIYASTSWFENKLDMSKLPYKVWCAQYYKECQYKGEVSMWQYTSEGSVNGVKGVVDMNECYITKASPMPSPTPKPTGKAYPGNYPRVGRAGILIKEAARLAWPSGTPKSKYRWKGGSATEAFTKALDKVYPEHNSWGPAPSKGCSCDVFVGTVVRSSGIDPKFPRGLDEQETYTPQGMFKYVLGGADMYKQSQVGDIIWYDYSGPGGHVLIRGKDCLYQAGYQSTYGHVTDGLDEIKDTEPKVIIFRPRNYLEKGDTGIDVTRLQKYVNWYFDGAFFKACGEADGIFGANTDKWVKKMQKKLGFPTSECDGLVGLKTTAAMKAVRK